MLNRFRHHDVITLENDVIRKWRHPKPYQIVIWRESVQDLTLQIHYGVIMVFKLIERHYDVIYMSHITGLH